MCCHSVAKLHDSTQMFVMVVYVRKMTVKKSNGYGDGLSEHVCFLFVFHTTGYFCCSAPVNYWWFL